MPWDIMTELETGARTVLCPRGREPQVDDPRSTAVIIASRAA
jgi:hypothetical protein